MSHHNPAYAVVYDVTYHGDGTATVALHPEPLPQWCGPGHWHQPAPGVPWRRVSRLRAWCIRRWMFAGERVMRVQ